MRKYDHTTNNKCVLNLDPSELVHFLFFHLENNTVRFNIYYTGTSNYSNL